MRWVRRSRSRARVEYRHTYVGQLEVETTTTTTGLHMFTRNDHALHSAHTTAGDVAAHGLDLAWCRDLPSALRPRSRRQTIVHA